MANNPKQDSVQETEIPDSFHNNHLLPLPVPLGKPTVLSTKQIFLEIRSCSSKGQPVKQKLRQGINIIGRAEDCDIQILDYLVSRHHCRIELTEQQRLFIVDIGSKNGTFINSLKIPTITKHEINQGDILLIGNTIVVPCL